MTKNDNVKTKSGFYRNKSKFDTELFGQDLNFFYAKIFSRFPTINGCKV